MNLMGAAVFMLLLWTAMRRNELKMLKADALLIDGKPMDLEKDAMEQVEGGRRFDLRRIVFKTEDNLKGKDYLLPLPKIGAQAFAVLLEFYRNSRERLGNQYLLPVGGIYSYFSINGKKMQSSSDPISHYSIYTYFLIFCSLAGVERQHPHQCRKTLATLMINHDPSSLELIRDLLCHKSVAMTVVYLMSLPGVAEDIQNYMLERQREKIVEYLTDAAEGKLAGAAGNKTLDAVSRNIEAFQGKTLATTVKSLVDVFTKNANFEIIRTPAAWCLRFPSRVPWTAPCLPPKSRPGEYIYPNPEKCRPWECKDAGHTTKDLHKIKDVLSWTTKASSESQSCASRAYYEKQMKYWERDISMPY